MATDSLEEEENALPFDSIFFNEQINRIIEEITPKFNWLIKKAVIFHLVYLIIGISEIALLLYFLPYFMQSAVLSLALGLLFLTFFSYFVLKLYLESKRPEIYSEIEKRFLSACQELIGFREEFPEHHFAVASACSRFASSLQGKEHHFYRFPKWLDFLDPTMDRFSVFCHWQDIHSMRELLLLRSIEEHIKLVKFEPTDLEVHAALANAYVALSALYINPQAAIANDEPRLIPDKQREALMGKFRRTAERAIEEFKILNDYAPDDPWVHLQLAYSYHDLGMPEKEIQEYEAIMNICPDDKDTLFKLGVLYLQQGENAKGLQVYEELSSCNYKKAEQLIAHYGDFSKAKGQGI